MSFSTIGLCFLLDCHLFYFTLFLQCTQISGEGVESFSFKTMSAALSSGEALVPNPFLVPLQAEEQGLIKQREAS